MGVYLCLGQKIHEVSKEHAINYKKIKSFEKIHEMMESDGKVFIYLGKGIHKIKRKAEQMACDETLKMLSI